MLFGALIWASVVVPPAYYLSENTGISSRRRTLLLTSIGVVYALLGSYAGWMSEPLHADDKYRDELVGSFNQVVAALVAGFMLLPLVCGWQSSEKRFAYPRLFELAWRNGLLSASVAGITGLFWTVLFAGAMLMKSLGLNFVMDILQEPLFIFPVTGTVVGAVFVQGHARAELLVNLRHYWLTLNTWLLPLLLFFGVMWVVALPMTGLAPLFKTNSAALMLLWFSALAVYFINCANQDGAAVPVYPRWLGSLLGWAWLTLILVTGVTGWAVALRIQQYGLSEDRVWAAFI